MDDRRQDHDDLAPRHLAVLRSVVRRHVATGEPVGSVAVAREPAITLSPASVRAVMAELEERGLLAQPHTSAGRVPTDEGYRVFVDRLVRRPRVSAAQARALDDALAAHRGDVAELLDEASRQLSSASRQVGLVVLPELRRVVIEHLEFVRLDERRVVAILVARSGVVHNRVLTVDEDLDQAELDRIGASLTAELGGRTLPQMRAALQARLLEERARYDRLMRAGLALGSRAVEAEDIDADVHVQGVANLLQSPEFADLDVARALFRTLEDKRTLVDLLTRVMDGEGVRVVIGSENPLSDLARCSLVTAGYGIGDRVIGRIGIVGPTRMEYARAIAVVEHLARGLTDHLSRS